MKKGFLILAAAASLTACNKNGGESKSTALENEIDSVSYSVGLDIGSGLEKSDFTELDVDLLSQGIKDYLDSTADLQIQESESKSIINAYFRSKQEAKQAEEMKKHEVNKDEAAKFFEENKTREEVIVTASGLQYEVLVPAEGPKPTAVSEVKVHYHGTLLDGTVFDSSVDRGEPVTFPVNGVIQGWQELLPLMSVGSKYKAYIPYDLAYGERAAGAIPPYSMLIFEVELIEIVK